MTKDTRKPIVVGVDGSADARRALEWAMEESGHSGSPLLLLALASRASVVSNAARVDEAGVAGGVDNLPWLFTATLVGMLALNLPFAYLVKRMPRARFVPITYRFFAANILAFALTLYLAPPEWGVWIGRVFFVWQIGRASCRERV